MYIKLLKQTQHVFVGRLTRLIILDYAQARDETNGCIKLRPQHTNNLQVCVTPQQHNQLAVWGLRFAPTKMSGVRTPKIYYIIRQL